jgi:ParB/RepB/Spo0J family partition protein
MLQKEVRIDQIHVPGKHRRRGPVSQALKASITDVGMKFPVILVREIEGGYGRKTGYILADGGERIRVVKNLGLKKILAVIHTPETRDRTGYARTVRVVTNHHRQNFYPSQRARYMQIHMKRYNISTPEMAKLMGKDPTTIANWLRVSDCSEEIQMLINNGRWPIRAAQLVTVLAQPDQMQLLQALQHREKVNLRDVQTEVNRMVREGAELTRPAMQSVGARPLHGRRRTQRIDHFRELSMPEISRKTRDAEHDIRFMQNEILSAEPVIKKIMKRKKLRDLIPTEFLRKFELFIQG